jgi:DNA-binding XRE family transcriptional regulator
MGFDNMNELKLLVQKLIEYPPVSKPVAINGNSSAPRPMVSKNGPKAEFRGEELKEMRERHGLSRAEMARLVGVNTKTYWSYEANHFGIPRYRFQKIMDMLSGDAKRG